MLKTLIYQTTQIKAIEQLAAEQYGISELTMMERAAKAAFEFIRKRWPQALDIAVFCGNGNNGGDGLILAQLLHQYGLKVTIWRVDCHHHKEPSGLLQSCVKANISIQIFEEEVDLGHPDLIVDAIAGTGLQTPLRATTQLAIHAIHRLSAPIVAIDVPTGINADTGAMLGTAIQATGTITYIGWKMGLLTGRGSACAGEIVLDDLGLPAQIFSGIKPVAEKISLPVYTNYLKPRSRDWHKGLSGRVVVIGGEVGFSGAPRMAGIAALRVGAGLVTIATRMENVATMNSSFPELMCQGVSHPKELLPLLDKTNVIVIGPGLGRSAWAKKLFDYVLRCACPLVIDADALHLLAQSPQSKDNWVLTPHPGEAAHLLNATVTEVQSNRLAASEQIHKRYGGVCILKGNGTLVIDSEDALPALCDQGNPGMATAGMGDILSGVIGGLLAQGIPLEEAARLGVYLHGKAGDMAAKEGQRGMIATDLLPYLRLLSNH